MTSTSEVVVLLLVINGQCVVTNIVPNITITGSITRSKFTSDLINISLNWYQAFKYCRTHGYEGLEIVQPTYIRVKAIKEFLLEHVPSSPTTVWLEHFRPSTNSSDWYNHNCKISVTPNELGIYEPTDQCAVLHYNPDSKPVLEFQARECQNRLPFLCFSSGLRKTFVNYDGYRVNSLVMGFSVEENQAWESCEDDTFKNTNSPVYEYNHITLDCTLYKIPAGHGYVEYDIYFTGENITTGVLDGMYNMAYINDIGDVNNDVSETFPNCFNEPETSPENIPDGYCPCSPQSTTSTEIPEVVTEPAVILKKSTSKFKRKLSCADDKRSSSTMIGAVAVTVIVLECGMVIVFDVLTLFMKAVPTQ